MTNDTAPTTWLLDVDGVINIGRSPWHAAPRHGIAILDGEAIRLRWAPQLIEAIRRIHATGLVDIQWSTTWINSTERLEQLFGLPHLGEAFAREPGNRYVGDLKFDAAVDVVDSGRRLIWTDDTEVPEPGGMYHRRLTYPGPDVLLIAPRERYGLTPEDLGQIERFVLQGAPEPAVQAA